MASTAQVQANRSNAQKSTGPRTPEGKAVTAQNAVKHGLLAQEVVVKGEDPGEFEFYRDQMLEELAPVGQMESLLAHRIVGLAWRLRRAERLQAAAFDKLEDPSKPPEWVLSPEQASRLLAVLAETGVQPPEPVAAGPGAGRRAVQDFDRERILDRLLVYERRIESSLYRTMGELRKQRLLREKDPPQERAKAEGELTGVSSCSCRVGLAPPRLVAEEESVGQAGSPNAKDRVWEPDPPYHPPEGGTPNVDGDESCETNPIGAGSNVDGTPDGVAAQEPACETNPIGVGSSVGGSPNEACETNPIDVDSNEGGTPNGGEAQKQTCETNPIQGPGSRQSNTFSEPRRIRRFPNTANEMTYDSYLGGWVATGVALSDKDLNQTNWGRRE
jgi:hypothetical protein